ARPALVPSRLRNRPPARWRPRATTAPRGGADARAAIRRWRAGSPASVVFAPVLARDAAVRLALSMYAPIATSDRGGRPLRQDPDRPSPSDRQDTADRALACTPAAVA